MIHVMSVFFSWLIWIPENRRSSKIHSFEDPNPHFWRYTFCEKSGEKDKGDGVLQGLGTPLKTNISPEK